MIIAMDFDGTYDRDPPFWDRFIADAQRSGHRVICVTARRETPENRELIKLNPSPDGKIPVYFTSLLAKRWYLEKQWNLKVDIWIDDRPEAVANGI